VSSKVRKPVKQAPRFGLARQIEDAQREIKRWPKRMRELARFEGSNYPSQGAWHPDLRD
jgi:hypothetical protein